MKRSLQIEADAARAEGTIVYAVGVGSVPEGTLLSIGGDPANVFDTSDFTELDSEFAVYGFFVPAVNQLQLAALLVVMHAEWRFAIVYNQ